VDPEAGERVGQGIVRIQQVDGQGGEKGDFLLGWNDMGTTRLRVSGQTAGHQARRDA
jgi:hypothetical protein